MTADVIDQLAGIDPGSHLDGLRRRRSQARENAQQSYVALFAPSGSDSLTGPERFAVATFVAALHRRPAIHAFYAELLGDAALLATLEQEIASAGQDGPYGRYLPGPLSAEDKPGPTYRVAAERRDSIGPRLVAALEHAHLLLFHPRDAAPAHLQALLDAGLTTTEVVTLSQLVAFLTFQIRVVAGLETLAGVAR